MGEGGSFEVVGLEVGVGGRETCFAHSMVVCYLRDRLCGQKIEENYTI